MLLKGGKKYQIKGCAGQGGFAKVLKAYVNSNPDEVVALKVLLSSLSSVHDTDCSPHLSTKIGILMVLSDTKAWFSLGILHV